MTENQLFWVKMFAPRSKKWMKEHLKALQKGVSHFETAEENQDKQTALKSLLK